MHQQAPLNKSCGCLAHVNGRNSARFGQAAPILLGISDHIVTRDQPQLGVAPAAGQAASRCSGGGGGRRDARHNAVGDIMGGNRV